MKLKHIWWTVYNHFHPCFEASFGDYIRFYISFLGYLSLIWKYPSYDHYLLKLTRKAGYRKVTKIRFKANCQDL